MSSKKHCCVRSLCTLRICNIRSRFDEKSGERYVFLEDIEASFEDARCVFMGNILIPFEKDENLIK